MADRLVSKTFKIEFEITVDMVELEKEHFRKGQAGQNLPRLKRLQKALLKNERVLTRQMLAVAMGRLQDYIDLIATQDNLAPLQEVAAALDPEDSQYFDENREEISRLTRPLRLSAQTARLQSSSISEKVIEEGREPKWKPVWIDLLLKSCLGMLLETFSVPSSRSISSAKTELGHYLLARHLTRQSDGVHFEGRCSCDQFIEGVGEDEEQAFQALWSKYKRHYDSLNFPRALQRFWKNDWKKTSRKG